MSCSDIPIQYYHFTMHNWTLKYHNCYIISHGSDLLCYGFAVMSKLKLIYFNLKGRAESIRLVLAASGTIYEDIRLERSEWSQHKPS